jgi:hypothetical protein
MLPSKQTMFAARSVSLLTAAIASTIVAFSPRTAGAQVPSDPCSPLTSDEVSAALGETVAAGQKATDKACAWTATKPKHQIVSLSFSPSGDWTKRKTQQIPGDTKVNLTGIGDEAFSETAGKYTSLYVKKGNTIFLVRVYGVPDLDQQLTIEKTIAKKVAAKV